MHVATGALVGRERELDAIVEFLAGEDGVRALVIEGEAGIGKTTLFEAALGRTDRLVLRARPGPGEAQLSYAAAGDLLDGVLDEVLAELPAPQRHALEVALRLVDADESGLDRHAVAVAFLGALRGLAARQPLVLAVDDVQWLDRASASVLEFALRRLDSEQAAVLLSRRTDDREAPSVESAILETRVRRLALQPFTVGALHHLIQQRLGKAYPRPTLRRLHASAGGNPFYALELARAIDRRGGRLRGDEPLPVPGTLSGLVEERIASLPSDVQHLLDYVAALSTPDLATVESLVEREGLGGAVDGAVRTGVLEVRNGRVAFSHPLLASGVYGRLGPERSRAIHLQLARVVADEEERALHLALGTSTPDDEVAAEIVRAAVASGRRGAPDTAASLLEQAARLTSDREQRARRLLDATDYLFASGDPRHSNVLLEPLAEELPRGPLRALVLVQLSWLQDGIEPSAELAEQALEDSEGDAVSGAHAHLALAVMRSIQIDYEATARHAAASARLAESACEVMIQTLALAELGQALTVLGHGVTEESRRAADLERTHGTFTGLLSGVALLGRVLAFTGELEEARIVLEGELERAAAAGHDPARATILLDLSDLEYRAGNWDESAALAERSSALTHQVATEQMSGASLYFPAHLEALRGDVDSARSRALAGLAIARQLGDRVFELKHLSVVGLIELSLGDAAATHEWLGPAVEAMRTAGVGELTFFSIVENELDALIALGRVDEADELVCWLEDAGRRNGRPWTLVLAARGRGLVQASRGDTESARASLDEALRLHDRVPDPFELARTLLVRGSLERREKRKRASREFLEQALGIFERLGAPLWAERARGELARLSLRSAPATLTETEAKIAGLAAQGLTNREIAAAAFVSPKTVEANLAKVYRKLGVRSRVELTRLLAERGDTESP